MSNPKFILPGKDVFEMHATHGFPPDLTRMLCRQHGGDADMDGYRIEMDRHREISRRGWKGSRQGKTSE